MRNLAITQTNGVLRKFGVAFLLTMGLWLGLAQQTEAQMYNDGRIRLRIWLHKVWSDANCNDPGGQELVFRDIQVRVPNNMLGGFDPDQVAGPFSVRAQGNSSRWYTLNGTVPVQNAPALQPNGYILFDQTYSSSFVPHEFQYYIADMFENDCGDGWSFQSSCGFLGLLADDQRVQMVDFSSAVNDFRGSPAGQVGYVQSDVISGGGESHSYAVIFAYQWDWVDPLPALCPSPNYNDGPFTFEARLIGIWSDSDYDGAPFTCFFGFAGPEDLTVKHRSRANIDGGVWGPWSTCVQAFQNNPQWNPVMSPVFNRTFSAANINMHSIDVEWDIWEDDACGPTCDFNTGCANNDNIRWQGITSLNWRDCPPNIWNRVDYPVRAGSGQYENWTLWVEYRWTMAAPTIVSDDNNHDRTLCVGTPTTLALDANNGTFYQWQVTNVTGFPSPGGPCPVSGWTDIAGANCDNYTPPQTPGTRMYRCIVRNRTGAGSTNPAGPRYNEVISDCWRVTYFPYAPPIASAACGSVFYGGGTFAFSVPTVPAVTAVANPISVLWTVSPSAGVTISTPTSTSTNITFPATPGTYTVQYTVVDACAGADAFSQCVVTVSSDFCGIIYASPTGPSTGLGGPDAPVSLDRALQLVAPTRNHIRLANGTYNTNSKISISQNDMILEGGFTFTGVIWTKNTYAPSGTPPVTININSPLETAAFDGAGGTAVGYFLGVEAIGRTGFQLIDIAFNVKNGGASGVATGTTGNRGNSVYGYYFRNSSGFTVERCVMNVGSGSPGAGGANGGAGANGHNGNGGITGHCDNNGPGGPGGFGAGSIGSGIRLGGAGGSGGKGSSNSGDNNANGSDGSGGGSGSGGSGAGGAGGNGGCGTNCNRDGRRGNNGGDGAAGADQPTTPPATSSTFSWFWLPNGQSAAGADGGGGGGGEGGGGGGRQAGTFCDDGQGSGGGGGGGGGEGGQAGQGGWGSGGAFAQYLVTSTGAFNNNTNNVGAAAIGGARGLGGNGGAGGLGGLGGGGNNTSTTGGGATTGGRVCGNCEVGAGGQGGTGGAGGRGGHGQPGANGRADATINVAGASFASASYSPYTLQVPLTATYQQGCTNSEVVLGKPLAAGLPFDFATMGGPQLVQNITPIASTFQNLAATTSTTVFYTGMGHFPMGLTGAGNEWPRFIQIEVPRTLPVIGPLVSPICHNGTVNLSCTPNSPVSSAQFEWQVHEKTSSTTLGSLVFTYVVEDPGAVTLSNVSSSPITYQIRLRVRDECCGWSIPVYADVVVNPDPLPGSIAADQTICINTDPANLSSTLPASLGIAPLTYSWEQSVTAGVVWTPATGTPLAAGLGFDPPILSQTTMYRRVVSSPGVGCDTRITTPVTITITDLPPPSAPSPVTQCGNLNTIVSATPGLGGNAIRFYDVAIGGTMLAQDATPPFTFSANVATTPIVFVSTFNTLTGCESQSRVPIVLNQVTNLQWVGLASASTDPSWFNPANWNASPCIPNCAINVLIPLGTPQNPTIGAGTASVRNITVQAGKTIVMGASTTFELCGDYVGNGGSGFNANASATVIFQEASLAQQTYEQINPAGNQLPNVVINKVGTPEEVVIFTDMVLRNASTLNFLNGRIVTTPFSLPNVVFVQNTNTNAIVGYDVDEYVEGFLRRNITATGAYDFPVGQLFAGNGYQLLNINHTAPTAYTSLTVSSNTNVLGSAALPAECGNNGYDAFIGNGQWVVTPAPALGAPGTYNLTAYPRGYNGAYNTFNYTPITGNASVTLAKGPQGSGAWGLHGVCVPGVGSSSLVSGSAIIRRNNITNGFSDIVGVIDMHEPFPVELLTLEAQPAGDHILVNWETATESQNAGFHLERSEDGEHFQRVGWVQSQAASGNSSQVLGYTFPDRNVGYDVLYYYRLAQQDFDGAVTLSNIVSAKLVSDDMFSVSLWPNPSTGQVNLQYALGHQCCAFTVEVFEATGRLVLRREVAASSSSGHEAFDLANHSDGVYNFRITNGTRQEVIRYVKAR